MEFFMAMVPPTVTHQEKQVHVVKGKPVFYEPADLKAARQKLMGHLAGHRPAAVVIGLQPFDYKTMHVGLSPQAEALLPEFCRKAVAEMARRGILAEPKAE